MFGAAIPQMQYTRKQTQNISRCFPFHSNTNPSLSKAKIPQQEVNPHPQPPKPTRTYPHTHPLLNPNTTHNRNTTPSSPPFTTNPPTQQGTAGGTHHKHRRAGHSRVKTSWHGGRRNQVNSNHIRVPRASLRADLILRGSNQTEAQEE